MNIRMTYSEQSMKIELRPIKERISDNAEFLKIPECEESLSMSIQFYARVGYSLPWIGYYATRDGAIVGSAAFKGRPMHGRVEIAYGTFPDHRKKGIGAEICRLLVQLAIETDPSVTITARTLPEENYSTSILRKNNFLNRGVVTDPDDGEVWEWEYAGP
jgi:ribosomal-protein-alanine N-acetyltransferase